MKLLQNHKSKGEKEMSEEKEQLKCSFCGKPLEQVYKLIAGPDVYICDECVRMYMEKLDKYLRRKQKEMFFCGKKEEKARKLIVSPSKKYIFVMNV